MDATTRHHGERAAPGRAVNPALYAALDLGTNNCRLSIARAAPPPAPGEGYAVLHTFARIVRLGEGVGRSGRLSQAAMKRTIGALKECARRITKYGVLTVRCIATSACRRADNAESFTHRVRRETGLMLEIIDEEEEARLAILGSASLLLPDTDHALVFDVGGGSTELIWLERTDSGGWDMIGWTSLPFGVVTMAEHHGHDVVAPADYAAMVAEAAAALAPFESAHGISALARAGKMQMLGTSGTVTTVAAIQMGLLRYNRSRVDGVWIEQPDIARISADLAAMTTAERAAHGCIGPGRADLVVAGCAIVEAIVGAWGPGRVRVADRGLREGILLDLIAASGG